MIIRNAHKNQNALASVWFRKIVAGCDLASDATVRDSGASRLIEPGHGEEPWTTVASRAASRTSKATSRKAPERSSAIPSSKPNARWTRLKAEFRTPTGHQGFPSRQSRLSRHAVTPAKA